ncbi:MAG: hypothetical protein HDR54_03405 [Treponema sp.]|nr:hypothetical protein [Treponema sp.]
MESALEQKFQHGEGAVFINQGVIKQISENGTYKLSTNHYPFISLLRNAVSGGISTFNCKVYFVRVVLPHSSFPEFRQQFLLA